MTKLGKKVTFLGLVLFLVGIFSIWTIIDVYAASTKTITVGWDMTETTDLAGFDLRINGDDSTIIDIPGADVREWMGTITFIDGNNILDMRAKDLAGQVSLWSEPCYYDPIPGAPTGIIVKVEVTVIVR